MKAFVLSGGGNRGALQVGALQVLLEAGIVPDIVVGASVGAINGALVAYDPSLDTAHELHRLWAAVSRDDLYPGNHLTALWSIMRGKESLFSNHKWQRFLERHMPCETFGEITATRYYVAATELNSGELYAFGEHPEERVVDALMASCALPPLHPPYYVNGSAYIDGVATANLPLRVAVEKGATEIYALNIYPGTPTRRQYNLLDLSARMIEASIQRQIAHELEHCTLHNNVWVRQIDLVYVGDLPPWDFSHTEELIALGRVAAEAALAQGPLRPPTWQEWLTESRDKLVTSILESTTHFEQWWRKEDAEQEITAGR